MVRVILMQHTKIPPTQIITEDENDIGLLGVSVLRTQRFPAQACRGNEKQQTEKQSEKRESLAHLCMPFQSGMPGII